MFWPLLRKLPVRARALVIIAILGGAFLVSGRATSSPGEPILPSSRLKAELVTAPDGAKPWARSAYGTGGVLDRDQLVRGAFLEKDWSSERHELDDEGFKYAVETDWTAPDGTEAAVLLLQFARSSGAQEYAGLVAQGTSQQERPEEPLYVVDGVPGAQSWTSGSLNRSGDVRQQAWLSDRNIVADVHYYTPGGSDTPGLKALVTAQYARLQAGTTTAAPLPVASPTAAAAPLGRTTPAAAAPADQARLLGDLPARPAGTVPWSADPKNGAVGVLTLSQFLDRFADTDDRSRVGDEETYRGFQYAVRENWKNDADSQVDLQLVQFGTAAGAQSFVLAYQEAAGEEPGGSAGSYAVPDCGDAMAYEHPEPNGQDSDWTEGYLVVGNIAVVLDTFEPTRFDRNAVTALLQQQYARLMADPTVAAAAKEAPGLPAAAPS